MIKEDHVSPKLVIDGDVDGSFRQCLHFVRWSDVLEFSDHDLVTVDLSFDALAGFFLQLFRRIEVDSLFVCVRNERTRKNVV